MSVVLDETREDIRVGLRNETINMQVYPPHPESLLIRRVSLYLSREQAQTYYKRLLDLEKEIFSAQQMPGEDKSSYNFIVGFHPSSLKADEPPDSEA